MKFSRFVGFCINKFELIIKYRLLVFCLIFVTCSYFYRVQKYFAANETTGQKKKYAQFIDFDYSKNLYLLNTSDGEIYLNLSGVDIPTFKKTNNECENKLFFLTQNEMYSMVSKTSRVELVNLIKTPILYNNRSIYKGDIIVSGFLLSKYLIKIGLGRSMKIDSINWCTVLSKQTKLKNTSKRFIK